jgi:tRNA(Glu) U13 pseudouridine synthase TruD
MHINIANLTFVVYLFLEFIDWKALGGDYLQVNMYKVGVDTMNAISILSKKAK